MKMGKSIQEMVRLLLGLVIVAAVTIAIISTLRRPAPGSVTVVASPYPTSSPQQPATPPQTPTTAVPYPVPRVPVPSLTLTAIAEKTSAEALAVRATAGLALRETLQARTPLPTTPSTFPPTGTSEDQRIIAAGKILQIDVLNGWRGIWDGKAISVYAGSSEPDQGIIVVVINSGFFGSFPTPTKHGGVRVVSEQDNRLKLVSTDGTTYYFDIPAMRYVPSMTVFAPSITPPPKRTPVPSNYETATPYPGP